MPDSSFKQKQTAARAKKRAAAQGVIAALTAAALLLAACQSTSKEYVIPPEVVEAKAKTTQAWTELWANDFEGANTHFSEASKVLGSSAEIYRGQGLANFALGK